MGWFNKKEDDEKSSSELPELPRLPEFPKIKSEKEESEPVKREQLHQLPSFPSNSIGQKFSQNAIKEAVTGKRGDDEDFDADEYMSDKEDVQMMHGSPKRALTNEISSEREYPSIKRREIDESPREMDSQINMMKEEMKFMKRENEPVFVRIDKFEEGMQILEKTKKEISEIEKIIKDTKSLKEEEEIQIGNWEKDIQKIKRQIEQIDSDIFSKIE